MGVSCLVSTGKSEVLDRFAFEIANIWLDVLGEIKEQENQKDDERCVLRILSLLPLFVRIDPVDPAHVTVVLVCSGTNRSKNCTGILTKHRSTNAGERYVPIFTRISVDTVVGERASHTLDSY